MPALTVIRDPQLERTDIAVPYITDDTGADAETEVEQTRILGIMTPLLTINDVVIGPTDIIKFVLDWTGSTPEIQFEVKDRNNVLTKFSNPGNDNIVRLQLIPPVDDTYKKVDQLFVCTDLQIQGTIISGRAQYLLKPFTQAQFKALGQLSTYDVLDKISTETGLGFATNVEATEDSRYMQCQYESYKDLISREIRKSGSDEVHVYDWWIDLWDYLVLCNLYDRVNADDTEEDMEIWVTDNCRTVSKNLEVEVTKAPAYYTNLPQFNQSSMYVQDFDVETNIATPSKGNNITLSVYEENKHEYVDHYIMDGDIQKNDFLKLEYAGEVYGDYNYLLAEKCREVYMTKIKSEIIVIKTLSTQLGINRGDQLRFIWYDNDTNYAYAQDQLEESGAIKNSEELQEIIGWLKDWEIDSTALNDYKINLQYSGQYTCIGQYMEYNPQANMWVCWMYLTRPASKRAKIMNELEEMKSVEE